MEIIEKDAFCVIGKAGSTNDGEGFVQKLWAEANAHFDEVSNLAARNEDGNYKGFWAEWCGGCKSACNMCSYATVCDNNVCPNVDCSKEKGLDGCYQCENLLMCETGFYAPESAGANASKALAIIRRDCGDKAVIKALSELHKKYDFSKLQEVLNKDLTKAVQQLKELVGFNDKEFEIMIPQNEVTRG